MLAATRFEHRALNNLPEPPEGLPGGGFATITQSFWDDSSGRYSCLLEEVVTYFDWRGTETGRIVEKREYYAPVTNELGNVVAPPILKEVVKETWGLVYLPGVTERKSLVLVKRETTTYFWTGELVSSQGDVSYERRVEGWCIRSLSAGQYTFSEVNPSFIDQGRKPFSGATRDVFDTTKPALEAAMDGEVVEEKDFPQRAVWVSPIEVEFYSVEKDMVRKATTRVRISYLRPGPPDVERHEELLPPREWRLQWPVEPPSVEARDIGGGVRIITVRGGGVRLPDGQFLLPDRYILYRRSKRAVVSGSALTLGSGRGGPLESVSSVTDVEGNPVTPIPGPFVGELEPESPPPPGDFGWSRICEARLKKVRRSIHREAVVQFRDSEKVELPLAYTAAAVVGGSFSELARPVELASVSSSVDPFGFSVKGASSPSDVTEVVVELPSSGDEPLGGDVLPGLDGGGEVAEFDLPLDLAAVGAADVDPVENLPPEVLSELTIAAGPLASGEEPGAASVSNVDDFLSVLRGSGVEPNSLGGDVIDVPLSGFAAGVRLSSGELQMLRALAIAILARQAAKDAGQVVGSFRLSPAAVGVFPGQVLKVSPVAWDIFGAGYRLGVTLSGTFLCRRVEVRADGSGFNSVTVEGEELRAP